MIIILKYQIDLKENMKDSMKYNAILGTSKSDRFSGKTNGSYKIW